MPGELARRELPEIVYMLSINQNASVNHPIVPAVIAPSLAPFLTKNIENAMPKYHIPLRYKPIHSVSSYQYTSIYPTCQD